MSQKKLAHPAIRSIPLTTRLHAHAGDIARHLALVLTEEMLWRVIVFYILLSVHYPA